jgi:hypothetical protein
MLDVDVVLKSIGAAIGIAKAVSEAKTEYDLADVRLKMADVTNALADAKVALTDAQLVHRQKDEEIERLKKTFARTDETIEYQGKRYRKGRDGKPRGRAFCTVCWEEGRLFLLDEKDLGRGSMKCARCKAEFAYVNAFLDDQ